MEYRLKARYHCGTTQPRIHVTKYTHTQARKTDTFLFQKQLTNGAFQKRVDSCDGGRLFLETFGFVLDTSGKETLTLPMESVDLLLLQMTGAAINDALTNPFFGVL